MSFIKANAVQIGQSPTATQNFTLAVPSSPDGTIKLARGNAGATTQDVISVDASGNVSFAGTTGLGNISNSTAIATGSTTARSLANRFSDVVNVKDFGAVGDGVADDTAAIQAAINITSTQNRSLLFPKGVYAITTIYTNKQCCTWYFQQAELKGIASSPTDCIVKFDGVRCMIYGMVINGNFNTNYSCALNWYDATASSQYNNFFGLSILFAKKGIIYGPISGASTGFAQSENSIFGYTSYGVWQPIVANHSNGILFFNGSQLVAHNDGWGGSFDNTQNFAFISNAGVLIFEGCELQNSIANTSSYGAIVNGGEVYANGCITEFNVPFSISGRIYINGGRVINTQSVTDMFYFPVSANSTSKLNVTGTYFYRPTGAGSFSARSLVNNTGAASTIEIVFDNCEIWDWAKFVPLISDNNQSTSFNNCRYYPDGTQNANLEVYSLNTRNTNIIDKPGIDSKGYTTSGFYLVQQYGAATFALNADTPNSFYQNSLSVIPAGLSGIYTIDPTSLATIKSTGFTAKQFDKFVIEGWFRAVAPVGSQSKISIAAYDSSGNYIASPIIADNFASSNLSTSWKYYRTTATIPSGSSAAYIGFGVYGVAGEVRMCGLKVSKANWNNL